MKLKTDSVSVIKQNPINGITLTIIFCSFVLLPFAHAGTINGTIREGNKPLRNTQIVIICGEEDYAGMTNERGGYSINVEKRGRCTLTLPGMQNANHSIASSKNPVRYDFTLQQTNSGFVLKRR